MISKTIGFRGTLFSDTPICELFWCAHNRTGGLTQVLTDKLPYSNQCLEIKPQTRASTSPLPSHFTFSHHLSVRHSFTRHFFTRIFQFRSWWQQNAPRQPCFSWRLGLTWMPRQGWQWIIVRIPTGWFLSPPGDGKDGKVCPYSCFDDDEEEN